MIVGTRPFIPSVALTGGIASGKSTVAAEFAKLGILVIDTDEIARTVVEPGQSALQAIVDCFGTGILEESGRLDRKHLRELIFNDPAKKQALENILHPAIRNEQQRQASIAGGSYQLHVIPLLTETNTHGLYDRILLVDCPRKAQLQRLIARDSITAELAERMLSAQASREQRLAIADDVIDNNGDPALLSKKVASLHHFYLKNFASPA